MIFDRSFIKYKRYYTYIEPLFRNPVLRTYTALILSFLTISFFTIFAIRPTINTIVFLNKQINDGRFTDGKLQEKINALSLAQTEYNNVVPDLPVILTALPDSSNVPPFAQLLERIVLASGVSLTSFQVQSVKLLAPPLPSPTAPALHELGFTMVVSGEYRSMLSYLDFLENVQRLVVIDTVSIGGSRARVGGSGLSVNMTGKIYYYN